MREQRRIACESQVRVRIFRETWFPDLHDLCQWRDWVLHSYVIHLLLLLFLFCAFFLYSLLFFYFLCECLVCVHVIPILTAKYLIGKTCANKGGSFKVTCGSAYFSKPGSTTCMACDNDGIECCTRMLDHIGHLFLFNVFIFFAFFSFAS